MVQSTITTSYRRWHRARQADNLGAYVHTMLVHAFIDERRLGWSKVRLLPWLDDGRNTVTVQTEPQAVVDDRHTLTSALRALPPRQRAVLVLRFLCDRSVDEVAETLRCSPGTVNSQTSRGLAVLREMLGDEALQPTGAVRSAIPR